MANNKEERESQVREAERFNEQCFLIDNWQQLAAINIKTTQRKPYRNFTIVQGDPGLVTHDLVGKKEIDELLEIKAEQVSLLLPRIRITKIEYPDPNSSKTVEKRIFFRDHTNSDSIENITSNRVGRGDDVGLKSFSYELAGKNIAEGGLAKCKLSILFQSVGSLLAETTEETAAFKDLIIHQSKIKGNSAEEKKEYNSEHFRIKVEAGWAEPSDPTGVLITEKLRRQIRNSRTILFMTLLRHEFNFNDDGSVELSIEYQGAVEAALNNSKSDLLNLSLAGKIAKNFRDEISTIRKERQRTQKKKPSPRYFPSKNQNETSIKHRDLYSENADVREDTSSLQAAILAESVDLQIRYSRIVNSLLEKSRMYYTDISREHIEGFNEAQREELQNLRNKNKITSQEARDAERFKPQLGRRKYGKLEIVRIEGSSDVNKLDRNNLGVVKRAKNTINKLRETESGFLYWKKTRAVPREEIAKEVNEGALVATSATPKGKPEERRINFFFFGDLLEVVLSHVMNNPSVNNSTEKKRRDLKNMSVLVGPIAFKDPRNPNSAPSLINLADIPISLNLFITWYMKEVVAPLRKRYFFDRFIKDVINTLIIPALGEDCFIVGQNQQHTISMTVFSAPAKNKQNPLRAFAKFDEPNNRVKENTGRQSTDIGKIKENSPTVRGVFAETSHQHIDDLYHFLYIYVSSWRTKILDGKKENNDKAGIFHLYPAADRGLVKSIKFKKQDQPFVEEFRASQDSEDLKRIRGRYSVNILMVGNTLFKPGMYIYIDTARFGLGNAMSPTVRKRNKVDVNNSFANLLGLGGYYQILKVNHNVAHEDYETELDCQWIFSGGEKIKAPTHKQKEAFHNFGKVSAKLFGIK